MPKKARTIAYEKQFTFGNSRIFAYSYNDSIQLALDNMKDSVDEQEDELPMDPFINGSNWADLSKYYPTGLSASEDYYENVVFIGDSRTEALMLYSGISSLNAICYKGLSVDKLETKAWVTLPGETEKMTCYEAVSRSFYDSYYLMFGVNELGWSNIDLFIEDFSKLIDHIYSVNTNAIVYVVSILPVTKAKSDSGTVYTMERVQMFNDHLLQMCKDRGDVIYLNLSSAIVDSDGYLPSDASQDGIHFNSNYCKPLIEYIQNNIYYKR
ncbi:MAG: GDSL-type esterase/lipase family protein [Lachnospiraceae bacterium]|nr:GDSL-type esterase/lipase family protein [Lachnospiraceae bacterium]